MHGRDVVRRGLLHGDAVNLMRDLVKQPMLLALKLEPKKASFLYGCRSTGPVTFRRLKFVKSSSCPQAYAPSAQCLRAKTRIQLSDVIPRSRLIISYCDTQ